MRVFGAINGNRLTRRGNWAVVLLWLTVYGVPPAGASHLFQVMGFGTLMRADYDPAGRYVVTVSEYRVLLWEADSGTLIRDLTGSLGGADVDVLFSPDGAKYVTWGAKGKVDKVRVWDTATGQLLETSAASVVVHVVRYCSDGIYLYWYDNYGVKVLSFPSCEILIDTKQGVLGPATGSLGRTSYRGLSADGRYLVLIPDIPYVRLWDLEAGKIAYEAHVYGGSFSCAFAPDNRHFLTQCAFLDHRQRYNISVWDVDTSEPVRYLSGPRTTVTELAVSPMGSALLAVSLDRILYVWDLRTNLIRNMISMPNGAGLLRFMSDGSRFLYASRPNTITVRSERSFEVLGTFEAHSGPVVAFQQTLQGRQLVTASDDDALRVWDIGSNALVKTVRTSITGIRDLAMMKDDRSVILAGSASGESLNLVDLSSGEVTRGFLPWEEHARSIALGSDDRYLAASPLTSPRVHVWDLETQDLVSVFGADIDPGISIPKIAFTRGGESVLGISNSGKVYRWDIGTTPVVRAYDIGGGVDEYACLAVSPDGNHFATTSDGQGAIWNLDSGESVFTSPLLMFSKSGVTAFSPVGSALFAGTQSNNFGYYVVQAPTWQPMSLQYEYFGGATSASFSPGGIYVLFGFQDSAIRIYYSLLPPSQTPTPIATPVITASPSPTPTPTLTPTSSPTAAPTGIPTPAPTQTPVFPTISSCDFRETTEGWRFVSTAEFDAPTSGYLSGDPGLLTMRAGNNTSTFGYWESPSTDLAPQGSIYTAEYVVRSTSEPAARAPQLRLRTNTDSGLQSTFLAIESLGDASLAPGAEGTTYTLVFSYDLPFTIAFGAMPYIEPVRFAFDLLDFDGDDDPAGELQLDRLEVTRRDVMPPSARTPLRRYTFEEGAEGWSPHSAAPFDAPTFGVGPGALTVSGSSVARDDPKTFGFWSSPPGDIPNAGPSDERVVYIATFTVESTLPFEESARCPQFRVRLNTGDFQAATVVAVESGDSGIRSPTAGVAGTYEVYLMLPPAVAHSADLIASLDYLNFDAGDDPLATLRLLQVDVEAAEVAW